MIQEKAIEPSLSGLTVSKMVELGDYTTDYYRIYFTDGSNIEFHGGSWGYENVSPYYERNTA